MYFCKGEDDQADTQCCLFTEIRKNNQMQSSDMRQQSSGISKINLGKNIERTQKESKLVIKSARQQKSQQKSKLSLSKLQNKRCNNSRDNFEYKQVGSNIGNSHASAPKSKVVQNTPLFILASPIAQLPQTPRINVNSQVPIRPNPSYQIIDSQTLFGQTSSLVNKNKQYNYQNSMLDTKTFTIPHFRANNLQKISLNHKNQVSHCFQTSAETVTKVNALAQKKYKPQIVTEQNSTSKLNLNQNSNLNLNLNLNLNANTNTNNKAQQILVQGSNTLDQTKVIPTVAPTLQSDRIMIQSQAKSISSCGLQTHPKLKTSQSRYKPHQSQFAESRFTSNLSPDFGRQNLKTVHSIYSSEIGGKKEVQESIILIDFFNPNEHVRKQIEQRINARPFSQFKS